MRDREDDQKQTRASFGRGERHRHPGRDSDHDEGGDQEQRGERVELDSPGVAAEVRSERGGGARCEQRPALPAQVDPYEPRQVHDARRDEAGQDPGKDLAIERHDEKAEREPADGAEEEQMARVHQDGERQSEPSGGEAG